MLCQLQRGVKREKDQNNILKENLNLDNFPKARRWNYLTGGF